MATARPICLLLDRQEAARALSRAWAKTGNRIAARMAMIAITTRSSIRVNPPRALRVGTESCRPRIAVITSDSFPAGNELGSLFAARGRVSLVVDERKTTPGLRRDTAGPVRTLPGS